MNKAFLSEKEMEFLFYKNMLKLEQYHDELRKLAEKRNILKISQKKNKRSMSSSKWN